MQANIEGNITLDIPLPLAFLKSVTQQIQDEAKKEEDITKVKTILNWKDFE